MLSSRLRRFTFTAHIASSLGWAGAAAAFLAISVTGLTSPDERTVRGVYLVMAPAAWFVLVPLAHASLFTGIVLSLGTTWGLFRHYWVVVKLLITAFSTGILLIYMETFRQMARVAADPVVELGLVRNPSPMVHAIFALVLLGAATVLGVYKPFGMTPYGRRDQDGRRHAVSSIRDASAGAARQMAADRGPQWVHLFAAIAVGVLLIFVLLHWAVRSLVH